MRKDEAERLLEETFPHDFDIDRFAKFIKELFNKIDVQYRDCTKYIAQEYQEFLSNVVKIGEYEDVKKRHIEVLVVKLKRTSSRDRARTMQRNFVAKWLGNYDKDAALVAFYGDDLSDWRFSFIKMEYSLTKTEDGKVKVATELTPAKRCSFLVGKNEPNHTAKKQLVDLLMDEQTSPTLEDLEEAFSVEKVTEEFFSEYKERYLELRDELEKIVSKNEDVRREFAEKCIDVVDFSKRLLGQIVFIYFLQKKGWLGVGKDPTTGKFKKWGEGPKDFLRRLFDKKIVEYKNFFNDVLEPLFYEALARPRLDEDAFFSKFNCKIPFLNGGLFEPINGYSWHSIDILISDDIFKKILSTFDTYNFTVKEDEPLDKEVAIDPEMLGKVFENLLEVKDRKSKGAYYTPREIVHYMCQQSLINYLETNTGINRTDIEHLIYLSDFSISGKENLPKSIEQNYRKIDNSLKNIKIVDPAVGSGAFPVGMMNKIVKMRTALTPLFTEGEQQIRTTYNLKREAIENSLYGVDIEPSAVDIAQLRFWLSLIVDEESIDNIRPLPNLDHKIMCGNSLLEEFEGKRLFDERLLQKLPEEKPVKLEEIEREKNRLYKEFHDIHTGKKQNNGRAKEIEKELKKLEKRKKDILSDNKEDITQLSLHSDFSRKIVESQKKLNELKELQSKYFNEQNREIKRQLAEQIDIIEWEFIEETLKEQNSEEALHKLQQYKKYKSKPFFLWKLFFAEIFQNGNPGFDIVIANPPYLKERDNKQIFEIVNKSNFGREYHQGKMDYWYYFLHKAIDISRSKGTITYITSRYWLNSNGAKKLIRRIKNELCFVEFVDIGKLKVFNEVAGQHMVAVYQRSKIIQNFIYKKLQNDLSDVDKHENTKNLQIKILSNIDVFSDNDEIILEKTSFDQLNTVHLGKITDTSVGVQESPDKLSKKQIEKSGRNDLKVGQGVFVLTNEEIEKLNINEDEKLILKKYLDPNDIIRYKIQWNNKYLIYSDNNIKEKIRNDKRYSNLKAHLDYLKDFITSSNKPYGLHRPRKKKYFENPKIIFKNMFVKVEFAYDVSEHFYYGFSFSSIIQKDTNYDLKYILALLNSKFAQNWFYKNGKKRGAGVDIGVEKLRLFPVKNITSDEQKQFVNLVDKILNIIKDDDYLNNTNKQIKVKEIEKEIDQLVYNLYNLKPDEVKIIEKLCEMTS